MVVPKPSEVPEWQREQPPEGAVDEEHEADAVLGHEGISLMEKE